MRLRGKITARRIIAGTATLYGILMLIGGQAAYSSHSYGVAFRLASSMAPASVEPTTIWATGFIVAGLAALWLRPLRHLDLGLGLLLGMIAAWTTALFSAVWPAHEAQTWGGPLWPLCVAVLLARDALREP